MSTFKSNRIDQQSITLWEIVGQYVYLGYAVPGSTSDQDVWSIERVDKTNGKVLMAEGSADFIRSWDQRATYTYL